MTSLKREAHHKICRMLKFRRTGSTRGKLVLARLNEEGYALVALMALMTLLALFAIAVAPSIAQQAQRERENESIFRGEQVASAIREYYIYRATTGGGPGDQSLPTSIDQLLEGVPVPGGSKKRQVLRVSASRDPLSTSGEWRLIRPRSQDLLEFQRAVLLYANNALPPPTDRQMAQLQQFAAPPIVATGTGELSGPSLSGEISSADSSGPFVGVSSRSQNDSIIFYYGIERHDRWVFTPLFR